MEKTVEKTLFGSNYKIEAGTVARQASGAVLMSCEDTVVLATVVAEEGRIQEDFLPLTVNYQEKTYAAGKIPGGFFRREGRPSEQEILTSRLIDRSIRPLITKKFTYPTQVMITVLSADTKADPGVLSATAASAALVLSDVPFEGPIAGVKVGRINGNLVCNPSSEEIESSDMDIVVTGTMDAIVMVEGGAKEVSESDMIEALMFAHERIKELVAMQEELASGIARSNRVLEEEDTSDTERVGAAVREFALGKLEQAAVRPSKDERREEIGKVRAQTGEEVGGRFPGQEGMVSDAFDKLTKEVVRSLIVEKGVRPDSRDFKTVRDISSRVGILPRSHGSALFTRGETQALVAATLGTAYYEQRIDSLEGDIKKHFMLHYNFPPYCVGETSNRLAPGRREIGHGALAERAVRPLLPSKEDFPYTIRVVSEILESNGSSSMATVCGASMSLMDAGVPLRAPVGGVAMGLIKEGDKLVILSDILGDEDHLGDMDFKVAGTENGITALQMDIKIDGVTREILSDALNQAKEARLHVLGEMAQAITSPNEDVSAYAPRIMTIQIHPDKIRDVIGSGGKVINKLIDETGAQIDIGDDGKVLISSPDKESCENAINRIQKIIEEVEPGKVYLGKVKRVLDFGAIVEMDNGKDGLVHISELEQGRVEKVTDVVNEGDELLVKCLSKERDGKIRLSRKEALGENIEDYR
ncbi:MAG: polyribonucleotide nucleotidyltransferase [Candidatus Dadabacteria bacterium]|nr:polyribonucleotide nucleotidyltransferase [Candidatus Dadabacteria bacterium]